MYGMRTADAYNSDLQKKGVLCKDNSNSETLISESLHDTSVLGVLRSLTAIAWGIYIGLPRSEGRLVILHLAIFTYILTHTYTQTHKHKRASTWPVQEQEHGQRPGPHPCLLQQGRLYHPSRKRPMRQLHRKESYRHSLSGHQCCDVSLSSWCSCSLDGVD